MITRMKLDGCCWILSREGQNRTIPARVPGCVHADLLAAGRIPDPFYRDNERSLLWIGETDWTCSRDFCVDPALLNRERVLLRCEGLDTVAAILINGREIGRADNMFRTWEFDLGGRLRPGRNTISIRFASPVRHAAMKNRQHPLPTWQGPPEPPGRAWLRKEQCSFGWDWGPIVPSSGIWRSISIIGFDTARFTGLQVSQVHRRGAVRLEITPEVERTGARALELSVTATLNGRAVAKAVAPFARGSDPVKLTIRDPKLWWPNNMGNQPLYEVSATLTDSRGRVVDTILKRVGLRTLRLDRHPDKWGESFQFVVNGIPFFAKGANWIPADAIVTRMTRERYARLLHNAAAANMNMLRVWGGGIYENDVFYDLCDELGICVWQDFMFACNAYPSFDRAFMRNVEAEAEDNVRRLRHHPCMALWCGNNELEMGLVGKKWTRTQMSWKDYGRLFDKLLPGVVAKLHPGCDYWPSSPHTPVGDRTDFNSARSGDAHLWDVWHGRKPFEWYRTCEHRFNSEFGFQSFPEPRTVRAFTAPEDRNVTSRVMELHQRSYIGNSAIMQYMCDWFRLPSSFDNTLWLSQVLHGMAMKYAVEHWRRAMPRGMGTLYWQINDCWPVASWASLDFHGRWKALHYMARRFYAPLLVSGVEDTAKGTVEIHVTSDLRADTACRALWRLTDLRGRTLARGGKSLRAKAGGDTLVRTLDARRFLDRHGPRNLLLWLDLVAAPASRNSPHQVPGFGLHSSTASRNLVLFCRPKHMELEPPRISAVIKPARKGAFAVTLKTDRPALWTWLELDKMDAAFSDNFVHLRPGQPERIIVSPSRPVPASTFRKSLRIRNLIDTYARQQTLS